MSISYGVSFTDSTSYVYTAQSSLSELEAIDAKIVDLLKVNQNRLQACRSQGRRFNLGQERKILLTHREKVSTLIADVDQKNQKKVAVPEQPSGWPTWTKVALIGTGVLVVGGLIWWYYSSSSTNDVSIQTPSIPQPPSLPTPPPVSQPAPAPARHHHHHHHHHHDSDLVKAIKFISPISNLWL